MAKLKFGGPTFVSHMIFCVWFKLRQLLDNPCQQLNNLLAKEKIYWQRNNEVYFCLTFRFLTKHKQYSLHKNYIW